MNTNLEATSTLDLRTKLLTAPRGSDGHEAVRAELARRVAGTKAQLDVANDRLRSAMKNDQPGAEAYYRNRRDELNAELDRALGF